MNYNYFGNSGLLEYFIANLLLIKMNNGFIWLLGLSICVDLIIVKWFGAFKKYIFSGVEGWGENADNCN